MKEKGDIFSQFRDSFDKMGGHFHILEQRVPVELQVEYFKYSEKIRKERQELTDTDFETFVANLSSGEASMEYKRYMLSLLATSRQVRAYRILEEYVRHPPTEDVTDWACMALMESRISLESELSDEKQIFISTGLGGKDGKLRFYLMLEARENQSFQDYQRRMIEQELPYLLEKEGCEIERLSIFDRYVELVVLFPVHCNIRAIVENMIHECNLYGDFFSDSLTITNVKEPSEKEVYEILNKKHGDSQASD